MDTIVSKLQAVINTLERMNIPSTYDNTNKLLGIYQTLLEVIGELNSPKVVEIKPKEEKKNAGESKTK